MSYQNFKSDYIQFNSFDEKDSAELSKALDVFINSFDNGEYVFGISQASFDKKNGSV